MVSDCENMRYKYGTIVLVMFFKSFELISSMPHDEESLMFFIREEMPSVENASAGMLEAIRVVVGTQGILGSLVNTDENAMLKILAHSAFVVTSPYSLVRLIVWDGFGLTIGQKFFTLSLCMLGRSMLKNACLALRIAVR